MAICYGSQKNRIKDSIGTTLNSSNKILQDTIRNYIDNEFKNIDDTKLKLPTGASDNDRRNAIVGYANYQIGDIIAKNGDFQDSMNRIRADIVMLMWAFVNSNKGKIEQFLKGYDEDEKVAKVTEYKKEIIEPFYDFLQTILPNKFKDYSDNKNDYIMKGGGYYKHKYLKYKNKYLAAKNDFLLK